MNTFTDANMIVARTHCQSNGLFAQRSRSLPCLSTAAGIGHLSCRRRIRARVDRDDGEVHARGASSNSRGFVREAIPPLLNVAEQEAYPTPGVGLSRDCTIATAPGAVYRRVGLDGTEPPSCPPVEGQPVPVRSFERCCPTRSVLTATGPRWQRSEPFDHDAVARMRMEQPAFTGNSFHWIPVHDG